MTCKCLAVKFSKFLRTPILKNICELLFLKYSFRGCLYDKKTPRLQLGQPSASVSWDDFNFRLHEKFRFAGMNILHGIVLSLVQFDFIYSSAIITFSSAYQLKNLIP